MPGNPIFRLSPLAPPPTVQEEQIPNSELLQSNADHDVTIRLASSPPDRAILKVALPRPDRPGTIGIRGYRGYCQCTTDSSLCDCWVSKNVAPNGVSLKFCEWHSGGDPAVNVFASLVDRCYTAKPPTYGYWDTNLDCYDTCWRAIEDSKSKQKEAEAKLRTALGNLDGMNTKIEKAFTSFSDLVANLTRSTTELASLRSTITAKVKPATSKDSQLGMLEKTVELAVAEYERATANAEHSWAARGINAPELPADDIARNTFFACHTGLSEATTKLKKARDKLSNWNNKLLQSSKDSDLQLLREQENILANQVFTLKNSLPVEARTVFFESYTGIEKLTEVLSVSSEGFGSAMMTEMSRGQEFVTAWKQILTFISEYIPVDTHVQVAAAIQKERDEMDSAAIAIKNTKTVTHVDSGPVLGQLFISTDGEVQTAEEVSSGPLLVVRTRLNAFEASPSKVREMLPLPDEYEMDEDVTETYDDPYTRFRRGDTSLVRKALNAPRNFTASTRPLTSYRR